MVVYCKDLDLGVPADLVFLVPMLSATNDFSPRHRHLLRRGSAQAAGRQIDRHRNLDPTAAGIRNILNLHTFQFFSAEVKSATQA